MELGFWIAQNLSDIRPSIRILLLLHRLKYPLSEYTQKWVSKLLLYRETLPPGERRSFDIEFCLFPSNYQQLLSKHITNSRLISTSTVEGKFLSFSSSSIWETQQNFYRSARLSAWQDVPFEISNNNLICDIYMQQIDQFLGTFPNNSKVCIVEVGAGHGILSLLLARQLSKRNLEQSLVIATDFHSSVFLQLLELPWYLEMCERGYLEFCECPASTLSDNDDDGLKLLYSGKSTKNFGCWDLLVVIGNYAFDSFPVDLVYYLRDGSLREVGQSEMDVPQLGDLAKRRRITKSVTTLASIPIPNSTMTKDRLLRDMMNLSRVDCEAERKAEAVMSAETPVTNFSSCMLTIPTSASNLLKKLKSIFQVTHGGKYMLLVGDSFLDPRDPRWQSHIVEDICIQNSHLPGALRISHLFEPPFISPRQEAVALPLSLVGMISAFHEAFGSFPESSTCTPLHGSDFVILSMLSPTSCHQSQTLWALAQPRSLHFGPNELCTLRQYLSDECRARSLPIDCFLEVFSLSSHDWIMYSQFMWRLRDALLALGDQDQAIKYSKSLIHQILEALKTAVPTSVQEYLCHRGQFIRFLYSLAKRIPCLAFDCILHIFHSSSLCFPRLPALVDISFRLQTKSLVAYCKAHLLINENECEGQHLRLRMYSPQELYIFFKCLVLIAANEESYQLSQLCYTIMTPTSTMKNYSSRFSTPRVLKQEKRQWAKIRKIFLSHSTRSERKDEVRENTLPSPTELDIIVSPNFD